MIFPTGIIETEMKITSATFWYRYSKRLREKYPPHKKDHKNAHAHVVLKNTFKAKQSDYPLRIKKYDRNEELYLWKVHFRKPRKTYRDGRWY